MMTMTSEEHAAFMRGFSLARPPGPEEADALKRAKEFAPAGPGQLPVAVSKDLAKAILAEVEAAPECLAGATWIGFIRGMVAKTSDAPVYCHEVGRA